MLDDKELTTEWDRQLAAGFTKRSDLRPWLANIIATARRLERERLTLVIGENLPTQLAKPFASREFAISAVMELIRKSEAALSAEHACAPSGDKNP